MTEIRSYRRVFDLERRVYSVDRLQLNPGGVPVRGVVYFVAILAVVLLAAEVPLLGAFVRLLPWFARDVALPGLIATVLAVVRVEGRVFHLAARALLRYWLEPRRLLGVDRRATVGERWEAGEIVVLPDGSDSRLRRLRYTGPGAVRVALEHERAGRAVERDSIGTAHPRTFRARNVALILRPSLGARPLEPAQIISLTQGVSLLVLPTYRRR